MVLESGTVQKHKIKFQRSENQPSKSQCHNSCGGLFTVL